MGGIVARGLNTVDNYIPNSVDNIITFASPHKFAFLCDLEMENFYEKLNHFWRLNPETNKFVEKDLENMFVVSIGGIFFLKKLFFIFLLFFYYFFNKGSFRDTLIDHPFIDLDKIIPKEHQISVATDSIPEVIILLFLFFII
jgi:hypothetical protein